MQAGSIDCCMFCHVRHEYHADLDVPMCCRAEEEATKQAMQDATLREQAQADRDRTRQVGAPAQGSLPPCCVPQYLCVPHRLCPCLSESMSIVCVCACVHASSSGRALLHAGCGWPGGFVLLSCWYTILRPSCFCGLQPHVCAAFHVLSCCILSTLPSAVHDQPKLSHFQGFKPVRKSACKRAHTYGLSNQSSGTYLSLHSALPLDLFFLGSHKLLTWVCQHRNHICSA